MQDLLIVGASGFGREVAWVVERINRQQPTWNLLGFLDDNAALHGSVVNGYPVLGGCAQLPDYPEAFVVCAVGASKTRRAIIDHIKAIRPQVKFATLIDPGVEQSDLNQIGAGTIICAHTIITVNVTIGEHVIINLDCTVGHDAILHDFVTLYPSVNVSGITEVGAATELGTGANIIQGRKIGAETIVGAGSVVVKDIPDKCTAVGSPAKPIKFFE